LDWFTGTTTTNKGTALKRFTSGDELLRYFRQQAMEHAQSRMGGTMGGVGANVAFATAPAGATGAADESGGQGGDGTTYTTTNVQEAGVDEGDVFKSDGTNFYIAKGRSLRIARAVPFAEMGELGSLDFEQTIDSIYLNGSTVLVLAQKYDYGDYYPGQRGGMDIMMWPPYFANSSVVIYAVDVTDPNTPVVTAKNELDGALVSSRLTDGRLIVVLTFLPQLPDDVNTFTVGALELGDVMPMMRSDVGDDLAVIPENCYYPETPNGYSMIAVVTLDAANIASVLGSVAVLADAQTIYASTEAVYAASTDYGVAADYRASTVIHKFKFSTDGVPDYAGSGAVPGTILNQFSLGEYEGYLRVATHLDAWGMPVFVAMGAPMMAATGSGGTAQGIDDPNAADQTVTSPPQQAEIPTDVQSNAVWVLGENAGKLEVVGKITGIAPNETLYAARFMGNRGYLVTYRKVDPLFVLDLNDPTNPQKLGELKIPGYSEYLHPWGDTHLIGVGKATQPTDESFDWFQGVQISLFDVSDWSNPQVVQQLTFGGRGSECDVSSTHKAFAFLADSGLLALPMRLTAESEIPWEGGDTVFDGVIAFRVERAAGFAELGRLDSVLEDTWDWTAWHRPAFIGDILYAVTPEGVRAADVADFSAPAVLELTPSVSGTGGAE
jgi:uncharacterized secreted protein with C-terminal beta-propeller domain